MDGLNRLNSGFDRDCHSLLNAVAAALTRELSERARLELPAPTGKSLNDKEIKISIIYQGPATAETRDTARTIMQRAGNAAEMLQLLKRVGLG